MTTAYFSPTLNSFIPVKWKDDGTYNDETWPFDAVLATDDETVTFWKQTPPPGKLLGEVNGRPAWVDEPVPTQEQIVALAEAKKSSLMQLATNKISVLLDATNSDIMGDSILPGDAALLKLWRQYRVLLSRIDTSTAPDIDWPIEPME